MDILGMWRLISPATDWQSVQRIFHLEPYYNRDGLQPPHDPGMDDGMLK